MIAPDSIRRRPMCEHGKATFNGTLCVTILETPIHVRSTSRIVHVLATISTVVIHTHYRLLGHIDTVISLYMTCGVGLCISQYICRPYGLLHCYNKNYITLAGLPGFAHDSGIFSQ